LEPTEKTKQEILASGQGIEMNGIVWATSDVGMRGSFVLHYPQEFTSDGVFIGDSSKRIFLPFNKNSSVNYLLISSDYAPEVFDGAMKEQMKCRCVLNTVN